MSDLPYVAPTPGAVEAGSVNMDQTLLSEVRDLFNQKIAEKFVVYPVGEKDRVTIRQNVTLGSEHFQRIMRASSNEDRTLNTIEFAANMLAETNTAILVDGVAVQDAGRNMTMMSDGFRAMVNSPSTVQAVRALFGGDGGDPALLSVSNDMVVRTGYGDIFAGTRTEPVEIVDPT